ncbi:MAG: glycosyltransferase, partial [Candidatus Methylomirabilales bacterium]
MRATILHIAETAGYAGGERYLLTLAQALDRTRFRLEVAVPEGGPLIGRLQELGIPVHQVPLGGRPGDPRAVVRLFRLFRACRPALVQSHGARTNVYTKLAGWLARVPVVLATVHNSLFDYEVPRWRRR